MAADDLVIRSRVRGRLYLGALAFGVIGAIPFLFFWLGISELDGNGAVVLIAAALIVYALCALAAIFLGYPLLRVDAVRVALVRNPFVLTAVEFDGLGPAHAVVYRVRKVLMTGLVFRSVGEESRATGAPTWEAADIRMPLGSIVGHDDAAAAGIAAAINAKRSL